MEVTAVVSLLTFLFTLFISITLHRLLRHRGHPQPQPPPPPSPPSLPIIGHLHLLGHPLHRVLTRLSAAHGPLLLLRLGSRPALIASSPSTLTECFTTHDLTFANRPHLPRGHHLSYNYTSFVTANYGPHWRNLRRITKAFFSSTVCTTEVCHMLHGLHVTHGEVDMREKLSALTFDVMMRMIAGKRASGSEEGRRFRRVAEEVLRVSQLTSVGDMLPWLGWFDFGGLAKRTEELGREMDKYYQELIEERRNERRKKRDGGGSTVIDVFLSLQEEEAEGGYYTDVTIKGVILSLILAGTETSSVAMEWAMALLLNHPQALQKARTEIDSLVGHDRLVDETDLPNLQHLNNVIKETLRMYPPVPLLLPHESSADCTVGSYSVPGGTLLFANAYAIHRDPKLWEEPIRFNPERFCGGGDGNKMFPFGMGRRSCPGEGLAMRMMGLVLGSLVQCFEWERVGDCEVDMTEGEGLTLPMAKPLKAKCMPRELMVNVLDSIEGL